ncbi:hypothetical protein F2Q68_00031595 [Brassica cretica]|uniref:Uncharacterized protein n=1 Tax=Brassica cretica TaxID=69181 RepID=A0A8S9G4U4_BRACR|nr:hypothetical protein F2Q68_00031595 [Brassica cretica]
METNLVKHILSQNHLTTHMKIPATKENSWQEEADSEISLEETNEHDEHFSKTEDVDGGEACSQSGETENKEESYAEERAWCYYSDQEDDPQGETSSQISVEDYGDRPDPQQDIAEEEDPLNEAGRYDDQPGYIHFAGHHQGPEAYLCWEKDMGHWFDSNQVHEEEKTAIAEDTLTEDAIRQWERDA